MKHTIKRVLASVLAMAMLIGILPTVALASFSLPIYQSLSVASEERLLSDEDGAVHLNYSPEVDPYHLTYTFPVDMALDVGNSGLENTVTGTFTYKMTFDSILKVDTDACTVEAPDALKELYNISEFSTTTEGDKTIVALTLAIKPGLKLQDIKPDPLKDYTVVSTIKTYLPASNFDPQETISASARIEQNVFTGIVQQINNIGPLPIEFDGKDATIIDMRGYVYFRGDPGTVIDAKNPNDYLSVEYPSWDIPDEADHVAFPSVSYVDHNGVAAPKPFVFGASDPSHGYLDLDGDGTADAKVTWYEEDAEKNTLREVTDLSKEAIKDNPYKEAYYVARLSYLVTYEPGDHGTLSEKPTTTWVDFNTKVPSSTVPTVIPDKNWTVSKPAWTDANGDPVNPTDVTITKPTTFTASYDPNVTFVAKENGTLTDGTDEFQTKTQAVSSGTKLAQVIPGTLGKPSTDYHFVKWTLKDDADDTALTDTYINTTGIVAPTTYYAHFLPNVFFKVNDRNGDGKIDAADGGTLVGETTYDGLKKSGDSVPAAGIPTANPETDYHFAGWVKGNGTPASYLTNEAVGKEAITDPTTFVAHFEPNVTFDPTQYGSIPKGTELYEATTGQKVPAAKVPTATPSDTTKYYFAGWYVSTDDTKTVVDPSATAVTDPIKYVAKYEPIITFLPGDHGTLTGDPTYEATVGNKIPADSVPTVTVKPEDSNDYHFIGWKDEQGNLVDPTKDPVTDPATYTATYAPNVIFTIHDRNGDKKIDDKDGGTINDAFKDIIYAGITETNTKVPADEIPTAAAKDGYYFAGWKDASGKVITPDEIAAAEVTTPTTYTAFFEPTVTFDPTQNGSIPKGTELYEATTGQKIPAASVPAATPSDPTKYYFAGWYNSDDKTQTIVDPSTVAVTDPTKYVAKYEPVVNFLPGDHGTLKGDPTYEATTGSKIPAASVPTATPTDPNKYYVTGWKDEQGNPVDPTKDPVTGPATYTATYEPIINFLPGDHGTLDGDSSYEATTGDKIPTDKVPTVNVKPDDSNDYYFTGWKDEQGNPVDPTKNPVTGPATYTATYQPYVHFETTDGGTIDGDTKVPGTDGEVVDKIPTPVPNDGYKFDGWFTPDGKPVDPSTTPIDGPTTYVGHFSEISKNTLTFESNGGTSIDSITRPTGETVDFAGDTYIPTKEGFTFDGWFSNPELTGDPITSVVLDTDKTVYAKWTALKIPEQLRTDHVAYIIGYPGDVVRPKNNITRAEAATIFFRLLKDEVRSDKDNWATTNTYSDVSTELWFNNAVSTLSKMGIITGYPDGTFRPNNPITRAEFATIAARFVKDETPYTGDRFFSDVSGNWAEEDIYKAVEYGWINGYTENGLRIFKPKSNITRAEVATLVNRMLNRDTITADNMLESYTDSTTGKTITWNTWSDNTPHDWFYVAMQEATNSHVPQELAANELFTSANPEKWQSLTDPIAPDWAKLEKEWANSGSIGADVAG